MLVNLADYIKNLTGRSKKRTIGKSAARDASFLSTLVLLKNGYYLMVKQIFILLLFTLIFQVLRAHKGNNGLILNGEAAIPTAQNDHGAGFFIKGLYGIGRSAQLTLSGEVSKFHSNYWK